MKVACIQLSSGENYKRNFKSIISLINRSIKNKPDLIITPETSSIITSNKKILFKNTYRMSNDPLIKEVKKISKKNKKWILLGSLAIKDGKKYRNRSIMIGPKGNIVAYYDKIKTYKAGKKLVTVKLPWGRLGLTICYDLRFPEIYRSLSKKNLNFISVPSAFTKITGQKHWLALLKARAIENFCYIFAPNQYGKNTKQRETFGHSVIISPDGNILKLKKKGIGIVYSNINPNMSMNLRKIIPSLN